MSDTGASKIHYESCLALILSGCRCKHTDLPWSVEHRYVMLPCARRPIAFQHVPFHVKQVDGDRQQATAEKEHGCATTRPHPGQASNTKSTPVVELPGGASFQPRRSVHNYLPPSRCRCLIPFASMAPGMRGCTEGKWLPAWLQTPPWDGSVGGPSFRSAASVFRIAWHL